MATSMNWSMLTGQRLTDAKHGYHHVIEAIVHDRGRARCTLSHVTVVFIFLSPGIH